MICYLQREQKYIESITIGTVTCVTIKRYRDGLNGYYDDLPGRLFLAYTVVQLQERIQLALPFCNYSFTLLG